VKVVLFDFDGVIVRGDAFTLWLRHHYLHSAWRCALVLVLLPILLPMFAWRGSRAIVARWVVRIALLGLPEQRYRVLAEEFGRSLAHESKHFSRDALTTLGTHRHAGDRILIVTACEQQLAAAILDELGFGDVELVASQLVPGRFGMRIAVRNRGIEKARQLALRSVRPPWDVMYSDSLADLPILAAARSAVLVNPDRATLEGCSRRLGRRLSLVEWV
jgi:phosphatidylglycerophosphatase C